MCFSGGKDSALALREIQQQRTYEVGQFLTTVTDDYDRVSMHGVRRTLLRQQAEAIGIPLREVVVPPSSSNAVYETGPVVERDSFVYCDLKPNVGVEHSPRRCLRTGVPQ